MYVIYDPKGGGWVQNSPIEGWIFTILLSNAGRFSTQVDAMAVIGRYYGGHGDRLQVRPLADEQARMAEADRV